MKGKVIITGTMSHLVIDFRIINLGEKNENKHYNRVHKNYQCSHIDYFDHYSANDCR